MASAKDIVVKPITSAAAREVVKRFHYSGKVVNNSQLHFGVFIGDKCGGAMQFGPPLDRRKLLPLVRDTLWNEMIELNRMAFGDLLPRNSESRALSVAFRIMRKAYPHIKWVVSFADAAQCGDGTIYRASGFALTGIKENNQVWEAPQGEARFSRLALIDQTSTGQKQIATRLCRVTAEKAVNIISRSSMTMLGNNGACAQRREHEAAGLVTACTGGSSMKRYIDAGFKPIPGFQLRYIYFLDPMARERLTVPVIPFSKIAEVGAGMYKGKPTPTRAGSIANDAPAIHAGEGGATPTPALQTPLPAGA